jgi:hypothetical protein
LTGGFRKPTAKELAEIKEIQGKVTLSKKDGAEIQQRLFVQANKARLFEYKGFTLKLVKLPVAPFMRILAKIPEKLLNPPPCEPCQGTGKIGEKKCEQCNGDGVYLDPATLTPEEQAQCVDVFCEGLSAASADHLSPDEIGRMSPPEFPEEFLGEAFRHLLLMNQATQPQIQKIGFFRRKP